MYRTSIDSLIFCYAQSIARTSVSVNRTTVENEQEYIRETVQYQQGAVILPVYVNRSWLVELLGSVLLGWIALLPEGNPSGG